MQTLQSCASLEVFASFHHLLVVFGIFRWQLLVSGLEFWASLK